MATDGLIVVDKPAGLTSHDVVARVRRIARTRRVGHAGTLDPMATGVLVVGVERATRLLTYLVGLDKAYAATIRLGESTITDDAEGEVRARTDAAHLQEPAIRAALAKFVGEIDQVPSAVSAIKVRGVRSYARVRAGEEVTLPARRVRIDRLDVTGIRFGATAAGAAAGAAAGEAAGEAAGSVTFVDVDVELTCSAGTYVRALARDLGVALGVGGHLVALRRTAAGRFTLRDAVTLAELETRADPVTIPVGAAVAATMPIRSVEAGDARRLSHGGPLPPAGRTGPYAVAGPDGTILAVVSERDGMARPEVVLAPAP